MPNQKSLLSIVELGGYADFTPLYQACGFTVTSVNTMRKALSQLRRLNPDVIIAEFIYGPTYGSQLSNFESLLAGLQTTTTNAKLIALVNKKDSSHFATVSERYQAYAVIYFPIDRDELKIALSSIG